MIRKRSCIGWEVKRISEKYEEPVYYPHFEYAMFSASNSGGRKATGGGTGKAGSMARFMIYDNTLFTLNTTRSLAIFDIQIQIWLLKMALLCGAGEWKPYLFTIRIFFIGARNGMYIYDINNPFSPQLVSQYSHFMSCDPVVVDDNFAYITLRAGNFCGQKYQSTRCCRLE